MPKAVYRSGCRDEHNCPQCALKAGPLTSQSNVLTTWDRRMNRWTPDHYVDPTPHTIQAESIILQTLKTRNLLN